MQTPKMIIFDYGQTLVDEKSFDVLKGTEAVLQHTTKNCYNASTEDVCELSKELYEEIQGYKDQTNLEVHTHLFQNYLYEYFEIEFSKSPNEIERIFENAASVAEPTKNIDVFLQFLQEKGIRTGVISNMSFSGNLLIERINRYIPSNKFEFIISTSEYVFRKPHKRIFELALRKAKLKPNEIWYCGDNAMCDVDGAASCGIFCIWYKGALENTNKLIPKKNYMEINDWIALIQLLEMKEE